jgi:acyl carrier protein
VLDFPAFCALLGKALSLDLTDAAPDSRLDDLQIDSLCMIEILILFDEHGVRMPDALIAELRTAGDLHHYFTVLGRQPAPVAPAIGQTITVRVGSR